MDYGTIPKCEFMGIREDGKRMELIFPPKLATWVTKRADKEHRSVNTFFMALAEKYKQEVEVVERVDKAAKTVLEADSD